MAYADLGGLGSKQGAPAVYDWAAANPMPQLLPWLAILGLLMLKPNRCASAWWILAPLGCVAGLASAPQPVLALLPSSQFEMFLELIGALGFGLAAAWLLSSYLAWKHRLLAFLGFLLAAQGIVVSQHCRENRRRQSSVSDLEHIVCRQVVKGIRIFNVGENHIVADARLGELEHLGNIGRKRCIRRTGFRRYSGRCRGES